MIMQTKAKLISPVDTSYQFTSPFVEDEHLNLSVGKVEKTLSSQIANKKHGKEENVKKSEKKMVRKWSADVAKRYISFLIHEEETGRLRKTK